MTKLQWFPDPIYAIRAPCVDEQGVEYFANETYQLHTPHGDFAIKPGDWIVTGADNKRRVEQ